MGIESFFGNTCVAWDANALQYLAKGYSVIPLAPRQKGPRLANWSQYCKQLMTPDTALAYNGHDFNIGLCLGEASGVVAVDVDTDDPVLLKKIEKILPSSPVKKRGSKGYTAFYKYSGQTSKSVKNNDGTAGLDFLSSGRQTVLPPSVHPCGDEYVWLTEQTLLNYDKTRLPMLSETVVEQLVALFKPIKKLEKKPLSKSLYKDAAYEEAQRALDYISPDCPYDTWIQVGLALQQGFGQERGFELFNRWSMRSAEKYDGFDACFKKFRSFSDPREITINTLFFLARQNGYSGAVDNWEETEHFIHEAKGAEELIENIMGFRENTRDQLLEQVLQPCGFIAQVYEWIRKTSMYRQDLFALTGAVSIAAITYAQKFRTNTNARTNLYLLALGPTGSGKGKVCDQAQWLIANAPERYSNLLLGKIRSDAGLIDELAKRGGRAYAYIDEAGQFLRNIKSDNATVYSRAIGSELTELFSRAQGEYVTAAYSSAAKRPVTKINQPCLVVFGQTVPDRLFEALTKEDFIDGFFNRFLCMEVKTSNKIPEDNPDYMMPEDYYPTEIYEFMDRLDTWVYDQQNKINNLKTNSGVLTLMVPPTMEAQELLTRYKNEINEQRCALDDKDPYDYPLSRAYEHLQKLSLCACEFDEYMSPSITTKSVKWAKAVVDLHLSVVRENLAKLANSDYAKLRIQFLESLPVNVEMTKREYNRLVADIAPIQRKLIFDDMLLQGELEWVTRGDKKYLVRRQ